MIFGDLRLDGDLQGNEEKFPMWAKETIAITGTYFLIWCIIYIITETQRH